MSIPIDDAPVKMPARKPEEAVVGTISTLSEDSEVTVTKAGNVIVKRNGVTLTENDLDEMLVGNKKRKNKKKVRIDYFSKHHDIDIMINKSTYDP